MDCIRRVLNTLILPIKKIIIILLLNFKVRIGLGYDTVRVGGYIIFLQKYVGHDGCRISGTIQVRVSNTYRIRAREPKWSIRAF